MTDEKNFETALARLEEIVASMENESVPLDRLISLYEESIELNGTCRKILQETSEKISVLSESLSETPSEGNAEEE